MSTHVGVHCRRGAGEAAGVGDSETCSWCPVLKEQGGTLPQGSGKLAGAMWKPM